MSSPSTVSRLMASATGSAPEISMVTAGPVGSETRFSGADCDSVTVSARRDASGFSSLLSRDVSVLK